MHLQLLSGGDYYANLVQYFSMLGSLLGVSLIAEYLGADERGQVFAAVIAGTIPMGILQASSTQNDYVVSFWLVCCVYYLLLNEKSPSYRYSLGVGISLGLALLTKGTAYIYALPFLFWWLCRASLFDWKLWKATIIIAIIAVAINLGHYARNVDLYGHPLGPGQEESTGFKYMNECFTVSAFVSNIAKNLALHIGTPSDWVNETLEQGILLLHSVLAIGINDPRTTWSGTVFHIPRPSTHEDNAGNPLHLLLVLLSLASYLASKDCPRRRILGGYGVATVSTFLLFAFLLKWQPWHSRLHLPFFVLFSPFSAVVLSSWSKRRIADMLVIGLIIVSLPWVFHNKSRSLVSSSSVLITDRIEQYFVNRPYLEEPYMGAISFVKSTGCLDIGLFLGLDDWEYPLWVLLGWNSRSRIRLEHVNVQNISAMKASTFNSFNPCAIITVNPIQSKVLVREGVTYVEAWSLDPVSVFIR